METDLKRWMRVCEETDDSVSRIKDIAEHFRAWMESAGYEEMAEAIGMGKVSKSDYLRFSGFCNVASRKLAHIYQQQGFNATIELWEYHGDDLTYWRTHGAAFYGSRREFKNAKPWEYGESHEIVLIDGNIIVDVTSDQFNPEHPEAVVITKVGDRRYR